MVLGTLSALPTLVFSMITTARASASELARADRDSRTRANAISRELDQYLAIQISSIELLAGDVETAGGLDSSLLQTLLTRHRAHSPQLSFVYIANREGTSVYTDPPLSSAGKPNAGTSYRDRDYYQELLRTGRTTVSRVQLGRRSGVPNVQVVAPIHDTAGQFIGFAEGSIDLHGMHDAIAHAIMNVSDSRVIVTDGYGRVLADSSDRLGVLTDASSLALLRGNSDDSRARSTTDEGGTAVRASAALTVNQGWTVTVLQDQSSVEALADAARRDALLITGLALVLALTVGAFGVYWLAHPIRALAAATKAVGRGDFSKPVPQSRSFEAHEVAELLDSVRSMGRDVQHYRERTTALIDKLEEMNDELRTMVVGVEHAGNPVEIVDADGKLIYVNPAWEKLTGVATPDAIGRQFVDLLQTDRAFAVAVWEQVRGGKPWRGIYPCRRRDGAVVEVELAVVPVLRGDNAISHVVATRNDISEQRRAEEVMRMNDRLAAVGTLAAGVAHEINNPLTYVTANLSFLRSTVLSLKAKLAPAEAEDAIASFDEIRTGIDRVTNIVRDLRQLSRPDQQTTTSIDINALLESCVRMASLEMRHRATVQADYGDLPRIDGNEARLSQVFLNLLINAAQACDASAPSNVIRVVTRSPSANTITVEISDNGKGIDPEVIEHIFDAFFTTKPLGVGTGLGLSISHGIVKQLGGTITVDSKPSTGSTFRVTLPVAAATRAKSDPPVRAIVRKLKILIVDDEPSITTSLSRMLRNHEVTIAGDGEAALRTLGTGTFDVVLSDIMMPNIDGFELYRRVCAEYPHYAASFLFMTGGIVERGLAEDLGKLRQPCLYKPFTLAQLTAALAAISEPAPKATAAS